MTERKPEYHLYLYAPESGHPLWAALKKASTVDQVDGLIESGKDVDTLQLVTCMTDLFTKGYRIFVHPRLGGVFEITLGECERTKREIRMGHCLWRMLITGAFEI
jgi:hypothetical protein